MSEDKNAGTEAVRSGTQAHGGSRAESASLGVPAARSVITGLAEKHGMERDHFIAALKATVIPAGTTDAQFAAFCMVASQYDLNPLTKEIYAFPAKGGGIQPIVSIDGWCNIINSNPQLDGIEFDDKFEEGNLVSITCKISRKDRKLPVECIEYMGECRRDTDPWKKWPARMLRHKALIQCARYAFSLSGIVDQDEAERMEMVDVTPQKNRVFHTKKERDVFVINIQAEMDKAESLEELDAVLERHKSIMMDFAQSQNTADTMAESKIGVAYDMAVQRIEENQLRILERNADNGDFSTPTENEDLHDVPLALRK